MVVHEHCSRVKWATRQRSQEFAVIMWLSYVNLSCERMWQRWLCKRVESLIRSFPAGKNNKKVFTVDFPLNEESWPADFVSFCISCSIRLLHQLIIRLWSFAHVAWQTQLLKPCHQLIVQGLWIYINRPKYVSVSWTIFWYDGSWHYHISSLQRHKWSFMGKICSRFSFK